MKKLLSLFTTGLMTMFLFGCSTHVEEYKDTKPVMQFDQFFNGPVKAWGIVQDRSGKVIKRFEVDMVGTWNGDEGTLQEHFVYYDGEEQDRTWHIRKVGPDKYTGTADDIVGTATGESKGSAIKWNYVMKLPVGNSVYDVAFDDWMFQMRDGVLINRSYLKKFGIRMAELSIFMEKKPVK